MEVKVVIGLFYYVMVLSAAEEEKKNLTAVVGGNITLDHPGLERGYLMFGVKTIADVENKILQIVEDVYQNRVLWDQTSGGFTITDLQRNGSGDYIIELITPDVHITYLVTVIEPQPGPTPEPGPTPGIHSGGQNQAGESTNRLYWIVGVGITVGVAVLIISVVAVVLWIKNRPSQDHSRNTQPGGDPASVPLRELRADSTGDT